MELLSKVFRANEIAEKAKIQQLVPWLIGPTGSGKTTSVLCWAAENNYRVEKILLDSVTEIEFLGIPTIRENKTFWTEPEWFPETQNVLLFFDELDKARPEVIGTILTLIAERKLRDRKLPETTKIVLASQPISEHKFRNETLKALRARSVFLKVSPEQYIKNVLGINPEGLLEDNMQLPLFEKITARQLEWCAVVFRSGIFSEAECKELFSGIYPSPDLLLTRLQDSGVSFLQNLVRNVLNGDIEPNIISDADLATIISNKLLQEITPKTKTELCNYYKLYFLGLARFGTEEFYNMVSQAGEFSFTLEEKMTEFELMTLSKEVAEFFLSVVPEERKTELNADELVSFIQMYNKFVEMYGD